MPNRSYRWIRGAMMWLSVAFIAGCLSVRDIVLQVDQTENGVVFDTQGFVFLPVIRDNRPPIATTSHYMKSVDGITLAIMGCGIGIRDHELAGPQDSVVILDFGTPTFKDGVYGVTLFGFGPVSTEEVALAVEYFGWGYYSCVGDDQTSRLLVAVGTNNYFRGDVTYQHGQAWALMINDINQWFIENGYSAQVLAAGGGDLEVGWNTPEETIAWVNGYDSANEWPLYDFGDAAGCPPAGQCGTSSFPEWTQEDVWLIAWGLPPSIPLPLIYANSGVNARQWYLLSVYSYENHGSRMDFAGAVTQYQACQQRPSSICDLLDNTPEMGWSQLWGELIADLRTSQTLPWVTDFRWFGE